MEDGDDGHTFVVEAAKQVHDFDLVGDIEEAGWLIEEKDSRLLRERHGDPGALTFAAGKAAQGTGGECGNIGGVHCPFCRLEVGRAEALQDALVRVTPAENQLADGKIGGGIGGLGEDGETPGDAARANGPDIDTIEQDGSAERPVKAGHAAQEGALSAAVGANDGDHLAGLNVERDSIDDGAAVVSKAEVASGELHSRNLTR